MNRCASVAPGRTLALLLNYRRSHLRARRAGATAPLARPGQHTRRCGLAALLWVLGLTLAALPALPASAQEAPPTAVTLGSLIAQVGYYGAPAVHLR